MYHINCDLAYIVIHKQTSREHFIVNVALFSNAIFKRSQGSGAIVSKKTIGDGFELESQFILRVPSAVADDLREAVRQGNSNLKERLAISLESTNRTGLVRWVPHVYNEMY